MSESNVFDSVVINGKTDRQGINVLFLGLKLMREKIEFKNFLSLENYYGVSVCLLFYNLIRTKKKLLSKRNMQNTQLVKLKQFIDSKRTSFV